MNLPSLLPPAITLTSILYLLLFPPSASPIRSLSGYVLSPLLLPLVYCLRVHPGNPQEVYNRDAARTVRREGEGRGKTWRNIYMSLVEEDRLKLIAKYTIFR